MLIARARPLTTTCSSGRVGFVLPEFTSRDPVAFLGQLLLETEHRDLTLADVGYVLKTMARELLPEVVQ
jgi:hypothetical protein